MANGKQRRSFSTEEDQFLRDNLEILTNVELAEKLGRSKKSVTCRLSKLNLRRSQKERNRRREKTQFKKGHIPWTKGLKGIHLSPETEFKKGHIPPNTKWNGYISLRRDKDTGRFYYWIRIAQGEFVMLHQYLWEKQFGKLPEGYFLRFKNGDSLDVRLDNLIVVDRKKHLDLNRNPKKAGESMKKVWDEGRFLESDKWIAFTLSPRDSELRELILENKDLIELKRNQIKLKREIKKHEYA